jgi:hypothetical protein
MQRCHHLPPTPGWIVAIAISIVLVAPQHRICSQEDVAETTARPAVDATPIIEAPITAADREHWAFRPVVQPAVPAVQDASWPRSPIDAFILARLEKDDVAPAGEASQATVLRRLSFDLRGLPPSPEEVAAFESDRRPDAHDRLVDRLLASPAYGERWAQHWLDLARFAETDGFEHDKVRPGTWKYRDWVIAALNTDMPYDEFVTWQIAGEPSSKFKVQGSRLEAATLNIEHGTLNSSLATTFVLAGPDMPDINDQLERRHNLLNEATAAVGSVLLGLQMGCAQCHDHKYDPISQADFYRLRAVFEPAVPLLKRDVPYNVLSEHQDAPPARFWIRGDHRRPGVEVKPGVPRVAGECGMGNAECGVLDHSAFRTPRSALAAWLFVDDNPLTARVMVNRLWQHHFGRGIFDTPSDVGLINAGPTDPELLDWLAVELRDGGWGLKRMQRRILTSAAYRQAAVRKRLDGEAIRDAMLSAAGLMVRDAGGPGVMPPLPPELVGTLLKNQWNESPDEADHYRRSIYLFARRNLRYPIFEAFDRPDGNASCAVRSRSTTAPQSLLLFNSEFSLLAARHLAGRILKNQEPTSQEPRGQVEQLYLLTLSRRPMERELATLTTFLADQRQRLAAEARPHDQLALPIDCPDSADPYAAAALVDACLAIFNANEFVYVD